MIIGVCSICGKDVDQTDAGAVCQGCGAVAMRNLPVLAMVPVPGKTEDKLRAQHQPQQKEATLDAVQDMMQKEGA